MRTYILQRTRSLQMHCRFCSDERNSVTFPGTADELQKRQNPWQAKGSDTSRRRLSSGGKVEAAGIEPASRMVSTETSTCVVGAFSFARRAPGRRSSL